MSAIGVGVWAADRREVGGTRNGGFPGQFSSDRTFIRTIDPHALRINSEAMGREPHVIACSSDDPDAEVGFGGIDWIVRNL